MISTIDHNWQKKKIKASSTHQEKIYQSLNGHSFLERNGKKILLDDGKIYVEFLSCSYLGLDQEQRLLNSLTNNIDKCGLLFSSSRTRLKYKCIDIFEDMLNQIFNAYTVMFSSMHLTHLGLIPLLASGEVPGFEINRSGLIFLLDKSVHASIQINRGLMEQFGEVKLVDFNDLDLLEEKLKQAKSNALTPFLMSDSVGSMGGLLPITKLTNLVDKYSGYLYLDDAHGMSVIGKNGVGYAMTELGYNLSNRVILTTSLAKAFGTYGGVIVLPTQAGINFIKKYCSTYIFSGPPINPLINASIESAKIHLSSEIIILQQKLYVNLELFDNLISKHDKIINMGSTIPIRGIRIGKEITAINVGEFFKTSGFLINVAMYPTVGKGNSIIRLGICANHTKDEITNLCKIINSIL